MNNPAKQNDSWNEHSVSAGRRVDLRPSGRRHLCLPKLRRFSWISGAWLALCILAWAFGFGPAGAAPGATAPAESNPPAVRVHRLDQAPVEQSSWGSIRWLINGRLEPGSGLTLAAVELRAGQSNPLHAHHNCDEVIYVLSGRARHRVGKDTVLLRPGDTLRIPAGTPHQATVLGNEPLHCLVTYNTGERQFSLVEERKEK